MGRPSWLIDVDELKVELLRGAVRLLDVREKEEWERFKLPDAFHIPLSELKKSAKNVFHENDDIVIYCAHGNRSVEAILILRPLGFKKMRSLEGGIETWKQSAKG